MIRDFLHEITDPEYELPWIRNRRIKEQQRARAEEYERYQQSIVGLPKDTLYIVYEDVFSAGLKNFRTLSDIKDGPQGVTRLVGYFYGVENGRFDSGYTRCTPLDAPFTDEAMDEWFAVVSNKEQNK